MRCEKAKPLLDDLIGFHILLLHSSSISCPRKSIQKIKMYGDSGSPCLIPLEGQIRSKVPPIHLDRGGNYWDTAHNQLYKTLREVISIKHNSGETPLKHIIHFFQIDFYYHETSLPLLSTDRVNELLGNNSIICASSSWHKSGLERRDETSKARS